MKPKPDFEPMFQADRKRRRRSMHAALAVVVVTTLSGLSLRAGPIPARRPTPPLRPVVPIPGGRVVIQGGAANPQVGRAPAVDRFVIAAPVELDRAMVVRARDDIDPGMAFPEAGRRGSMLIGPAPAIVGQAPPR